MALVAADLGIANRPSSGCPEDGHRQAMGLVQPPGAGRDRLQHSMCVGSQCWVFRGLLEVIDALTR